MLRFILIKKSNTFTKTFLPYKAKTKQHYFNTSELPRFAAVTGIVTYYKYIQTDPQTGRFLNHAMIFYNSNMLIVKYILYFQFCYVFTMPLSCFETEWWILNLEYIYFCIWMILLWWVSIKVWNILAVCSSSHLEIISGV